MDFIERDSADYRRVVICMLLGSMVTFAILYAPQPLVTVFSKQYGVSPATASAAISLPTLSLAVSLLFVPTLSRRLGRKRVMSASLFATSVICILSVSVPNFTFFLAMRTLEGVSLSGFPAIAIAYLNEEISPRSIGGTMGAYVAGTAVGGFVGRVVVGPITDLLSWQSAFLVIGLFSLVFSVLFVVMLPASRHFYVLRVSLVDWSRSFWSGFSNKALFPIYTMGFLAMGAYVMLFNYIGYPLTAPPYQLSQTEFGFIFVTNLIGAWSSMMFGRMADKHARHHLVLVAATIFIGGILLTISPVLWFKIAGIAVFAFGFFGLHTTASGWVGVRAPQDRKATASSIYLLFYYGGSSAIGWLGGFVWATHRWGGVVMVACVLVLLCIGFASTQRNTST